jgi:hypothetical protein
LHRQLTGSDLSKAPGSFINIPTKNKKLKISRNNKDAWLQIRSQRMKIRDSIRIYDSDRILEATDMGTWPMALVPPD